MSEKFYKTNEFLAVQLEWRQRLMDEGFKDIERLSPDAKSTLFIEPSPGTLKMPIDEKRAEPSLIYYQMASKFLWDFTFKKEKHREIWRLHSEGDSVREIAGKLQRSKKSTRSIQAVIKRILPPFFKYIKEQVAFDEE